MHSPKKDQRVATIKKDKSTKQTSHYKSPRTTEQKQAKQMQVKPSPVHSSNQIRTAFMSNSKKSVFKNSRSRHTSSDGKRGPQSFNSTQKVFNKTLLGSNNTNSQLPEDIAKRSLSPNFSQINERKILLSPKPASAGGKKKVGFNNKLT